MAINASVQQYNGGLLPTVDPMLLPSGNPFKCHGDVLSLQPMIPPRRFDIFPRVGCSGLDVFRFFSKKTPQKIYILVPSIFNRSILTA